MRTLGTILFVGATLCAPLSIPAWAEDPADCRVAENLLEVNFPLPKVAKAIADKKLKVLVMGAGSSTLPGPNGQRNAYPARLQNALKEKLPGVATTVVADVKLRSTAGEMVDEMPVALAANKPALVVWQTGTVDAMLGVDPDNFSAAVTKGVETVHAAAADIILINSQYSPRTDSMIALGSYLDDMRWVALQQGVPLFDRFAIMKLWTELNTFDFHSASNKLDIAERVHDCMGRLLASLMIEATRSAEPLPISGSR